MRYALTIATLSVGCLFIDCVAASNPSYVIDDGVVTNGLLNAANGILIGTKARLSASVYITRDILTVTNNEFVVGSKGHGELHISGGIVTATNVPELQVGRNGGSGLLEISGNGQLHTTRLHTGINPGSFGKVRINGGTLIVGLEDCPACGIQTQSRGATGEVEVLRGKLLVPYGPIAIGDANVGTMAVSGGTVQAQTVSVGGGPDSRGLLTMSGGVVNVSSNITVAPNSKETRGIVSVTGGTLTVKNGIFEVGSAGRGELSISGGNVIVQRMKLGGKTATASGRLFLTGGRLVIRGEPGCLTCGFSANDGDIDGGELDAGSTAIVVGEDHDAVLKVSNGTIKAANLYLGYSPGFDGTMGVSGGVVAVSRNLIIGDSSASGHLLIRGGRSSVTNLQHTAVLDVRNGDLILNGGTLVVDKLICTNKTARIVRASGDLKYRVLIGNDGRRK